RGLTEPRDHRPGAAAAWESALAEAAAWDSDHSDRFQSAARWREEVTPRGTGAGEVAAAGGPGEGRAVARFVAAGWPETGAEVYLVNRRARAASGWSVALAVLTLGLAAGGLPRALRARGPTAPRARGALARASPPPGLAGVAGGLAGGSLGLACFSLGSSLPMPRTRRPPGPRRPSTVRRRSGGSSLATPALL